jgi:uncharacterized peroxidase-related enzyme
MNQVSPLTLEKVTLETAPPDAKPLLEDAIAKFGMIPNLYAHLANFPALLDAYVHGYSLFRSKSGFTPAEQEVIFLFISYENDCRYCMAAHSFVAAHMSKLPDDVTKAIRAGEPIRDARLGALSNLAKELVAGRGHAKDTTVKAFPEAGYTQAQFLAVILAIGVKTLSNYANHALNTQLDGMFAPCAWERPAAVV